MTALPSASVLANLARCLECLPPSTQWEVQTYIIALTSGLGVDPTTLARLSTGLKRLPPQTLLEIKAYLLATLGGLPTDYNTLAERAKCYECIPDGLMGAVQTYLLSLDPAGPGTSDPNTLARLANSFQGWPKDTLLEIQVYCLASNAGVTTDANALAYLARCMKCLNLPVLTSVITEVLNYVEDGTGDTGGGGGISGGGGCTDVEADLVPVITGTYTAGVLTSIDVTFPQVCCDARSFWIYGISTGTRLQEVAISDAYAGGPYTVTGVDVSGLGDPDGYYVQQECKSGDEFGPSNYLFNQIPPPSGSIYMVGAGDPDANGYYEFDQAEYDSSQRITYANSVSNYFIEFVGGAGGVEAYLYSDLVVILYRLLDGECFPHGTWSKVGADSGTLPVPNAVFLSYGESVARDWSARVVANGGAAPSDASMSAITDFLDGLYSDTGLRTKMKAINVVAPDSLTAAITPLLKSSGSDPWTNNNFVAGDLTVNGLVGDGATKYLNTGIIPSAAELALTSAGLVVYLYSTGAVANAMGMGCLSAAGPNFPYFALAPQWAGTGFYACWKLVNVDQDYIQWPSPAPSTGYYAGVRVASNSLKSYFARSTSAHAQLDTASGAQTATAVESIRPLFAFAVNNIGTPANYSDCRHSFFAVCLGLTAAESATLYGLILTMRTAFGGGYV